MTRTVRVRCTFEVDVEVPADWTDEQAEFAIEENSCPYTGLVGAALDAAWARAEATGTCACCPTGKNEIIAP